MKLLPVLLLAFALSLGVACSSEPSFEEAVATRDAEIAAEATLAPIPTPAPTPIPVPRPAN